ncbi:MAG: hypothetical protein J6M19_01725 [Bacteroidaceae bacterium]|nr:hypothetical protein [Bacteroidaceae bacterium]
MKKLSFLLLGMFIPLLCANCKGTSTSNVEETDNLLHVNAPTVQKFVAVSVDDAPIYKEPDTSSPTRVWWIEDIESDMADRLYEWSDVPVKSGYVSYPENAYAGMAFAVLGEEGDFYKVGLLGLYSDQEYGYILKSSASEVSTEPLTAEWFKQWFEEAEGEMGLNVTRVVEEGKYKGLVLTSGGDELDGPNLQVGVMMDGYVGYPCNYTLSCELNLEEKELKIDDTTEFVRLIFPESMGCMDADGFLMKLDPNKLSEEQIGMIVDYVKKQAPDLVRYDYKFPMLEGFARSFYFKNK